MPEAPALDRLIDRFLAHHAEFFPVDATFMGLAGSDHRLPPVGADARAREAEALHAMARDLDRLPEGATSGGRLDMRLLRAALVHMQAALEHWPRFRQPSWFTGEAAFGLIGLLLPSAPAGAADALRARLAAIPAFLGVGAAAHSAEAAPTDWVLRAKRECAALRRLLLASLKRHPMWRDDLEGLCRQAARAVGDFEAAIGRMPPASPACGRDHLALLMRDVHGLPWTLEEAVALAGEAFVRLGEEIAARRARLDAPSSEEAIAPPDLPRAYAEWHARALDAGAALVTPAAEYGLAFAPLPEWAQDIAGELYFLSYRSPPALAAGEASHYWTAPVAQPLVAVKQTHAVHHGSVGHHTQNARGRVAPSRLARLGGTDCASGIAFLSAGTMVEGWSCYATGLMAEAEGFYSRVEEIALLQSDRRNAASVLVDIRLHTGEWRLERARCFYVEEAGFPEARVWSETTRNSILPATRLMYFLGTEQIEALRREFGGSPRAFHDALIGHGHVPIAWAAEEMRRERD